MRRTALLLAILMCLLSGCGGDGSASNGGISVSAQVDDGAPFTASIGAPRFESDDTRAWFQHDLRLQNTTDHTLYVQPRVARRQVEKAGVVYLTVAYGPCALPGVCQKDAVSPRPVPAGESTTLLLNVYRGSGGVGKVPAGSYDVVSMISYGADYDEGDMLDVRLRYDINKKAAG